MQAELAAQLTTYTPNAQPQTPNPQTPQPSTLNPQTPNSRPETLEPHLYTWSLRVPRLRQLLSSEPTLPTPKPKPLNSQAQSRTASLHGACGCAGGGSCSAAPRPRSCSSSPSPCSAACPLHPQPPALPGHMRFRVSWRGWRVEGRICSFRAHGSGSGVQGRGVRVWMKGGKRRKGEGNRQRNATI